MLLPIKLLKHALTFLDEGHELRVGEVAHNQVYAQLFTVRKVMGRGDPDGRDTSSDRGATPGGGVLKCYGLASNEA